MLSMLIKKELMGVLLSPKFTATFAVCSLLMLLSVFTGIKEYNNSVRQYETAVQLSKQTLQEKTSWMSASDKVYRRPDPMQIFISGLTFDIGRWSNISNSDSVKLKNSAYSDDPIFAIFRFIDFSFIVLIVLSLFAILFTYDAISGEREVGTLKLIFSNSVEKAKYLLAKCLGSWLGLVVPVSIPVLLSLLMILAFGVPLSTDHWIKVFVFLGVALLFFSLFIVLGVFISAWTRKSNVSFLVALVVWVAFILIIPRAGVMAAGQMVHVPRIAEIEGQRDAYAKDKWNEFYHSEDARMKHVDGEMTDEEQWAEFMLQDSLQSEVERKIEAYENQLYEDLQHRKRKLQKLGFSLSRFSPASAFQLASMNLAETSVSLKTNYEDAMRQYRTEFLDYVEKKKSESGVVGGISISIDSEKGLTIGDGRGKDATIDISDRPHFEYKDKSLKESLAPVTADAGILALLCLLIFAGAFVKFLKYDVR